jgi:hypothetical protein
MTMLRVVTFFEAYNNGTRTEEILLRNMQEYALLPSIFMRSHDHEEEDLHRSVQRRWEDNVSWKGKYMHHLHEYDHSYRYSEHSRRDQIIPFRQPVSRKSFLDFILNVNDNEVHEMDVNLTPTRETWLVVRESPPPFHNPSAKVGYDKQGPNDEKEGSNTPLRSMHRPVEIEKLFTSDSIPRHIDPKVIRAEQERLEILKKKKRLQTRICKAEGCDKYVVDHGLCIGHGVCYSYSTIHFILHL